MYFCTYTTPFLSGLGLEGGKKGWFIFCLSGSSDGEEDGVLPGEDAGVLE